LHAAPAFAKEHCLPHTPQLLASLCKLTQTPPHREVPAGHVATHAPRPVSQSGVAPLQTLPQRPQFIVVSSELSQPFAALRSQSAKPALHAYAHAPIEQAGVVFGLATQAVPQEPQFKIVSMRVSQPFIGLRSQSAVFGAHPPSAGPPVSRTSMRTPVSLLTPVSITTPLSIPTPESTMTPLSIPTPLSITTPLST
jgi:hypothetical protein